jgi:hypothetical protein
MANEIAHGIDTQEHLRTGYIEVEVLFLGRPRKLDPEIGKNAMFRHYRMITVVSRSRTAEEFLEHISRPRRG